MGRSIHTNAEDADQYRQVIAFLEGLPAGAVVTWGDISFTADHPYVESWGDITVPDATALGLGWIWEIIPPEEEPETALTIHLHQDRSNGWTPDAISTALQQWADDHAGRGDLRFCGIPGIHVAASQCQRSSGFPPGKVITRFRVCDHS